MAEERAKILRDSEGNIRISNPIKVDKDKTDKIIEAVYVHTGINLGYKQLDISFDEYDTATKGIKPKGVSRRWTDEEERYVLLHHEEGDGEVGKELGRSYMSIFMHKSDLDEWLRSKDGQKYKDSTRKEQVDAFMDYDWED
jgi:hypothetical protein